jgi:hypothetical protein
MTQLVVALAATVAALAAVVWSGATRRRSLHYGLVVVLFASLGVSIYFAERVGATLAFEGAAGVVHGVHMVAVAATFLCCPLVLWSGWQLARRPTGAVAERNRHRKLAVVFVTLVLITSVLGTAMTVMATPRA